jgi:hypothetical protein
MNELTLGIIDISIGIICVGVGGITTKHFASTVKFMKETHADEWERLGSPKWYTMSLKTNYGLIVYLRNKQYEPLGDEEYSSRCKTLWAYYRVTLILLPTILIVFLLYFFI